MCLLYNCFGRKKNRILVEKIPIVDLKKNQMKWKQSEAITEFLFVPLHPNKFKHAVSAFLVIIKSTGFECSPFLFSPYL